MPNKKNMSNWNYSYKEYRPQQPRIGEIHATNSLSSSYSTSNTRSAIKASQMSVMVVMLICTSASLSVIAQMSSEFHFQGLPTTTTHSPAAVPKILADDMREKVKILDIPPVREYIMRTQFSTNTSTVLIPPPSPPPQRHHAIPHHNHHQRALLHFRRNGKQGLGHNGGRGGGVQEDIGDAEKTAFSVLISGISEPRK